MGLRIFASIGLVVLSGGLGASGEARAAAPVNDAWSQATALSLPISDLSGTLDGATLDASTVRADTGTTAGT